MAALKEKGYITPAPFDEPIEWTWWEIWHHEGRRARHGAAMMGPDYTWWHGIYEVAKHTYFEWIPELKEVAHKKDGNEKFATAMLEKHFKPIEGHDWYFSGLSKEALEKVQKGFEERYGGRPVSEGTGAPVMVLCRIAVAAGGVAKSSFQDVNGERSEAFMALAAHLLDRVEALGAKGVTADSLADGLDRLAAGTLAPEALRLHLMRLPADEAEKGVILLVAGGALGRRDYRPGVELGELRSEALSQETLQSLLAALAAAGLPELPARLPAPDVYRLQVRLLQHEVSVEARPVGVPAPPAPGSDSERLVRLADALLELR